MGYKIKVDSRSILGANQKTVREEVARKKEEYLNDKELKKIYQECKKAEVMSQKSGLHTLLLLRSFYMASN